MRAKLALLAGAIVKVCTLASSILLLMACLYRMIRSIEIMFFDLLALVLPYLVVTTFFFGFIAALGRKRIFILPLVSLLLWFTTLGPFYVLSSGKGKVVEDDITVLSYNIRGFKGDYRNPYPDLTTRILDFFSEQEAEILCLQEFAWSKRIMKEMKDYPYEYRYPTNRYHSYSPLAIFSKYPILSSGSLEFANTANNAIYADLLVKKDTLRVYNVHLQSLQFRPGSLKRENPVRLFNRLGKTINKQKAQVEMIYEHSRNSPYPYIICGDLNNTQYSVVYSRLKRNMKDSYLERGDGLGITLRLRLLPFRIDYVLTAPDFEITEHENFDVRYSDHYPIKASFRLPPQ